MSESATESTIVLPAQLEAAVEALRANPMTAPMAAHVAESFGKHYVLVRANNKHVFDILNNKDKDPKNTEIQDNAWERAVSEGTATPEMVAAEKRYQKAVAQMLKEKDTLRAAVLADVPKYIGEALTEEKVRELRNLVNSGKTTLSESATATAAIAGMADQMLALAGAPVENGVWSLMPAPDSLLNTRGKKGAGPVTGTGVKSTRISAIAIDGKAIVRTQRNRETGVETPKKAHFNHGAEELSRRFNAKQFESNEVTSEELEVAYYNSKGFTESSIAELRGHSTDMPTVHEFEFTKSIEVQNPNDDSTKVEPHTVKVSITRWTADANTEDDNDTDDTEDKEDAKGTDADAKNETPEANATA